MITNTTLKTPKISIPFFSVFRTGVAKMSGIKLFYYNFRGRAEPIRFILSYANVEFEDLRHEEDEWPALKDCELKICKIFKYFCKIVKFLHFLIISIKLINFKYF